VAHFVKCSICGERFDRDKEPFVQTSSRRYAHEKCFHDSENNKSIEEKDKEELEKYILTLFNCDYINPRIKK
jgi:hypothetical protein